MDIFLSDPNEIPLPPDEVRIKDLQVEPWPDGRRVKVYLEVDPFQIRPNADLVIHDDLNQEIAHTNIIESLDRKMEVNMHLRGDISGKNYVLVVTLYYASIYDDADTTPGDEPLERQVADQKQVTFQIPDN
jgi:hypothetical protein